MTVVRKTPTNKVGIAVQVLILIVDFYKYFKLEKTNTADSVCLEYKILSESRLTIHFYTAIAQEQLAERSGTEMHRSVANIMHAVRVPGAGRVLYRTIWHAIR